MHRDLGKKSTNPHQPRCTGHPDTQRTGGKSGKNVTGGDEGNERRMEDDRCNEEREAEKWKRRKKERRR